MPTSESGYGQALGSGVRPTDSTLTPAEPAEFGAKEHNCLTPLPKVCLTALDKVGFTLTTR